MTLDEAKAKLQAVVDELEAEGIYVWPHLDGIVVGTAADDAGYLDTQNPPR